MAEEALAEKGKLPLVFSGGVMANSVLRGTLAQRFDCAFATPELSSDNAAGVALIGSLLYQRERGKG